MTVISTHAYAIVIARTVKDMEFMDAIHEGIYTNMDEAYDKYYEIVDSYDIESVTDTFTGVASASTTVVEGSLVSHITIFEYPILVEEE